jgi:bis(5'-nucleosyl)-tetraphosphatase (symmetrical)
VLRGEKFREFLGHMYGNKPHQWREQLSGWDRLRFIVNCFTRLRFCTPEGRLEFKQKGHPDEAPEGYYPWYRVPGRASADSPIIFGHWSTLGLHLGDNVAAIDSGCLWGGSLTALRLEDAHPFQYDCPGCAAPAGD